MHRLILDTEFACLDGVAEDVSRPRDVCSRDRRRRDRTGARTGPSASRRTSRCPLDRDCSAEFADLVVQRLVLGLPIPLFKYDSRAGAFAGERALVVRCQVVAFGTEVEKMLRPTSSPVRTPIRAEATASRHSDDPVEADRENDDRRPPRTSAMRSPKSSGGCSAVSGMKGLRAHPDRDGPGRE